MTDTEGPDSTTIALPVVADASFHPWNDLIEEEVDLLALDDELIPKRRQDCLCIIDASYAPNVLIAPVLIGLETGYMAVHVVSITVRTKCLHQMITIRLGDLDPRLKSMVDSILTILVYFHANPSFCVKGSSQLFVGDSEHWCKFKAGAVPLSVGNCDADTAFAVEDAREPRIEIVGLG
ncbi:MULTISPECIES: hypothetical protein [Halobacterium]|uniref:Uncharacterized protein n=1 Tax=Halobacterium salinarum TaxID=2242 RepID=A0A841HFI8_HALSI|nr:MULTISPECIES: hypothetical protein [Halobacterium]MBB6091120.1 hypothetical protein [Halobacterium salinarum]MCF2208491.1 hypothetical protein [Halobacterium salinarum]MDL0120346.1 hypothetical protein [Halobacterium salinarum]MDL0121548.1 hypothetical protein [Halobacterium salinarum]MDL0138140.1 hypothetical protein [Halobacterium salinarum]